MGYVTNSSPIYNYPNIVVEADGVHVCTVTRKKDAYTIMQALKRDYKDIVVRFK